VIASITIFFEEPSIYSNEIPRQGAAIIGIVFQNPSRFYKPLKDFFAGNIKIALAGRHYG